MDIVLNALQLCDLQLCDLHKGLHVEPRLVRLVVQEGSFVALSNNLLQACRLQVDTEMLRHECYGPFYHLQHPVSYTHLTLPTICSV